jgi:spore maturation protein CgeB
VVFATDDPFNKASGGADLINCIPAYDMYISTKRQIMPDLVRAGARRPTFLPFAYKPDVHFPDKPTSPVEAHRFSCDVAFAGAADRDRIPYFEALARVPMLDLRLYGSFWQNHRHLRKFARGTVYGRDYRLALCQAKICIGLVRRANRDGHAMRSYEIPACGSFLLAERTAEHEEMFDENKEAVFFSSQDELREKIKYFLRNDTARQRIAHNGYRRVTSACNTYCDRLKQILQLCQT